MGLMKPPLNGYRGFSPVIKIRGVNLTIQLLLVLRLRMSISTVLPHTPSWRGHGQIYCLLDDFARMVWEFGG
jgi:hypothetical protein